MKQFMMMGVLALAGCGSGGVEIGPIPVSMPIEGGVIDPDDFPVPVIPLTYTVRDDFCALPTEQDIVGRLPEIAGIELSGIVDLTEIELAGVVLTAVSGDFAFLREITVSFVPKPVDGEAREPVVIGYAADDEGFGDSVILYPPEDVDLLHLIRANDDNDAEGCPQVEITITGVRPAQEVEWEGVVETDLSAVLGR